MYNERFPRHATMHLPIADWKMIAVVTMCIRALTGQSQLVNIVKISKVLKTALTGYK